MKFKLINETLDEKFFNPELRQTKYDKHVVRQREFDKNITPEEYERRADKLANTPVDHKTIVGYVGMNASGNEHFIKYNTKTEEYVVYHRSKNGTPLIVSFYHRPYREFTGKKAAEYIDELPDTE